MCLCMLCCALVLLEHAQQSYLFRVMLLLSRSGRICFDGFYIVLAWLPLLLDGHSMVEF